MADHGRQHQGNDAEQASGWLIRVPQHHDRTHRERDRQSAVRESWLASAPARLR